MTMGMVRASVEKMFARAAMRAATVKAFVRSVLFTISALLDQLQCYYFFIN